MQLFLTMYFKHWHPRATVYSWLRPPIPDQDFGQLALMCAECRVGFLPLQKVFLPGQWKKLVIPGNDRQKLAKRLVCEIA